jgi:hypothetical protein
VPGKNLSFFANVAVNVMPTTLAKWGKYNFFFAGDNLKKKKNYKG